MHLELNCLAHELIILFSMHFWCADLAVDMLHLQFAQTSIYNRFYTFAPTHTILFLKIHNATLYLFTFLLVLYMSIVDLSVQFFFAFLLPLCSWLSVGCFIQKSLLLALFTDKTYKVKEEKNRVKSINNVINHEKEVVIVIKEEESQKIVPTQTPADVMMLLH